MIKTPDNDRDSDNHDIDRDHHDIATPAGGALTSLTALGAMLNGVNTTSISGRSGLPLMQFKSRENNGTWMFGRKQTIPEEGSTWAVNLTSFKWGYVCFPNNNKPLEHLVSVSLPKPNLAELPDTGAPWQEEWAVNLKCLNGIDAGVEVVFKISTNGSGQAIVGLIETVRDRINGGQHGGNVVPILRLEKDFYPHAQYGRVWTPTLTIVDYMPLDGPPPATEPAPDKPDPDPQPRRRRVGA
jgi:hypothetical protein